jgi:oxygen-independent coproporphyrinogen-3 oxidase
VRLSELTEPLNAERLRQRIVKQSFYRASLRFLGDRPVWGSLSGIRPALLMRRLMDEGLDDRGSDHTDRGDDDRAQE